jgi:hypothetical protein
MHATCYKFFSAYDRLSVHFLSTFRGLLLSFVFCHFCLNSSSLLLSSGRSFTKGNAKGFCRFLLAMACNETGWMVGDDFPLTTVEVCTIHERTFRAIWFVIAFLFVTLLPHAISKLPSDLGAVRRMVNKGAPRTLPLWCVAYAVLGSALYFYKAATLWLDSDYTKLLAHCTHAVMFGIFSGPLVWSFLFALISPFVATAPDSAALITRLKSAFVYMGLLTSLVIVAATGVQALQIEGKQRVVLSVVFLSSLAFDATLSFLALGVICRKVCMYFLIVRSLSFFFFHLWMDWSYCWCCSRFY